MFSQFSLNILLDWSVCIILLFIVYELFFSDYIYNKVGLKTYYYKKDSVHYFTNFVDTRPILFKQNIANEKLLTDDAWLLLVGYILPVLFIVMVLPLILKFDITLMSLFPLVLLIYNATIITLRKKLNDYHELSEIESQYRHRFIPTELFMGIAVSIFIFILIASYNILSTVHMEFIPLILIILYLIMDNIILFSDKFIKDSSNDFRENNNFKKMIKIFLLVMLSSILIILFSFIIGFDVNNVISYYQSVLDDFVELQKSLGY